MQHEPLKYSRRLHAQIEHVVKSTLSDFICCLKERLPYPAYYYANTNNSIVLLKIRYSGKMFLYSDDCNA